MIPNPKNFATTLIANTLRAQARIIASLEGTISDMPIDETNAYEVGYRDGVLKACEHMRKSYINVAVEITEEGNDSERS